MKADSSPPPQTIDDYIAGFPDEVRAILQRIRDLLRKAAPEAEEAIRYQIPAFVQLGNVIFFAGYAKHVAIYPKAVGDETLRADTAPYEKGKGTYQFPLNKPIPYDLISRIAEARVKEHLEDVTAKGKKKKGTISP